jgi:hypothetical protein
MRKQIVKASWILSLAALITAGSVGAARADEQLVTAKVPFAFVAGETHLPAGDYIVKSISDDPAVLSIESKDGRLGVLTLTIPAWSDETTGKSELVFEKMDNQYFLSRIVRGDGDAREIVLTPAKKEHAAAPAAVNP